MKYRIAALTLTTILGVSAYAVAQNSPTPNANLFPYDVPEALVSGELLYAENCASCHGIDLEGQPNWRVPNADGRLPAPPHDITGHTWHHPDIQLFQIVKFGTAALVGNGYESDMAGYEDILNDQQILEIMAFIKSTWPDDIIAQHNQMNEAVAARQ